MIGRSRAGFLELFLHPTKPYDTARVQLNNTILLYTSVRLRVFAHGHTFFQGFEAIPLQFVIKARQGVANEALSHHH